MKQSISIHGYSKQEPFFNMVFRGLISNENRAFIRLLQRSGKSQREIAATCNVSRSSVQRICQRQHCTAKGSKVGSGGRVVKLMVAITHGEGVILCEPYETMNGPFFAQFVRDKFEAMISRADKGESRLFLQDGDPSQNSRAARDAMTDIDVELLSIPARSPDLNPIENIFKLVGDKLKKDTITHNITRENYEEFQARVIATIRSIPLEMIDKTISSMKSRISLLLKNGGKRLKY